MKSLFGLGMLIFALSFCNIGERLNELQSAAEATNPAGPESSTSTAETATLTEEQEKILENANPIEWEGQDITFRLPVGFNKMDVKKESFNYGSPASGFLIGTISTMPATFPSETSLKATYDSALEQLKQGKYEDVRWLEIDGITGVEWIEAMPEDKSGPRRHQWIAFRTYQGQNQQLNIMVSTAGSKIEDRRDTFTAILYSMKIAKG